MARAHTMTRDPGRLTARTFDVLVVGGGIYGLTIAYDCAQRGLSVALIDRGDFGSGARVIEPGKKYEGHTSEGHAFRIRDVSGALLLDLTPTSLDTTTYLTVP